MNVVAQVFSVFDRASESFAPPFAAPHEGVAIRGFQDAVNNPKRDTDLSNHPDDFDLYAIGEFNSTTGILTPHPEGKHLIIQGKQVLLQR